MTGGEWLDIPLGQLARADWNYKQDDEVMEARLLENMRRSGQIENLVVRRLGPDHYEVINGNHRLPVMTELGIDPARCFCVGEISQDEAVRLAIELNETRFATDPLRLAARLEELTEAFGREDLLTTLPFMDFQLDAYADLGRETEWHDPVEKQRDGEDAADGSVPCPLCKGTGRVRPEEAEIESDSEDE